MDALSVVGYLILSVLLVTFVAGCFGWILSSSEYNVVAFVLGLVIFGYFWFTNTEPLGYKKPAPAAKPAAQVAAEQALTDSKTQPYSVDVAPAAPPPKPAPAAKPVDISPELSWQYTKR